jgi:hypothetical protein
MQRCDIDLRTFAGTGKDAAQKMEDALERLLRQAATGADNSKHFESIVSCCDASKHPLSLRLCAFALIPSCFRYEGEGWGKLVETIISEVSVFSFLSSPHHRMSRALLTRTPHTDKRRLLWRDWL